MCVLLEQCVENVCSASNHGKEDLIQFVSKNSRLECKQLILGCENAAKIAQSISQEHQAITHGVSSYLSQEILISIKLIF